MEAATPQDRQSSKDIQREWPHTKDIKSSETRELVSNGDVPKGAADEAANSEKEQLAVERLQMVLERLYGQHYRAAQKFLRNRTLRKMNAKPGLTLYERIMAYRKLKESDEVQQTGGTSAESAGEQAASSTGSNSTSTAFQRSDTSFDSVDISDLTTFEEEKARTPTPEPTFDRRSNSAKREVRATYDEKLTARDVHVHLDEQISQDNTTNQTTRRVETTHRSNSTAGRTEHEAAAIATTATAVRAHSSSEQRETRVVEKKKEKQLNQQVSQNNTTSRTRHVETTHRSNSTAGRTEHEVAAIATTATAVRAHSSSEQRETRVVEKKKENQLNQQVSRDNTTSRTRHVETTHRSNSIAGSTEHEVAAIATTVSAERAHSSIKQKEAQTVEKKKEKPFNKQVSQDNTSSRTTRSVETTHRSNSTAGRTEHEVAAITTTVNAEHAHSSNEQIETRVVEKKKEKQLNQQGDKQELQTVKDKNINSSDQNINFIREQDITKQSHNDVINTTAKTEKIESLSDSRKQTTKVKDVVKEKHAAASKSVTEIHSRDENKVEEVAKTAKIQKSTSKTMESANKAIVANEIQKSIVEPRTSPDRTQSSKAPEKQTDAELVVPKVAPNLPVATAPAKPKPPPAGKAKPDPERKAADKKMAETIEALDKMADRSIQSLMGENATAADELPVDQETLNKVFSREFQAELDNFLRTT